MRTKTMCAPSGDQRGLRSREVDGARYWMGSDSERKIAMKLWSPRLVTNASLLPSGDHSGDPSEPRVKKKRLAGDDPSIGTTQTCRFFVYATRSPLGETTGSSPSASRFGVPPCADTAQISTLGCTGLELGSGGRFPSAFQL